MSLRTDASRKFPNDTPWAMLNYKTEDVDQFLQTLDSGQNTREEDRKSQSLLCHMTTEFPHITPIVIIGDITVGKTGRIF